MPPAIKSDVEANGSHLSVFKLDRKRKANKLKKIRIKEFFPYENRQLENIFRACKP